MDFKSKKPRKSITDSGLCSAMPDNSGREDNCVTIEVVSLKDVPLLERRKEANKPLYLTRYE